jgi:hypothetical protein
MLARRFRRQHAANEVEFAHTTRPQAERRTRCTKTPVNLSTRSSPRRSNR